jgi:uncharacterized membrane-anchored protein
MTRQTRALACVGVIVGLNLIFPDSSRAQDKNPLDDIAWQSGPGTGQLGNIAQIQLPEGYIFSGRDGVRKFLEMTQNPVSGGELGVVIPPRDSGDRWFVIFEFNSVGYVKDDEKDDLDAKAILESIKTGTAHSNEERRKRGWPTMEILGWHTPPRYDPVTNNVTWAIRGASEGSESVNYSVRLLGRRGVMDVDLVLDPTHVAAAVPDFNQLLTGFTFSTGNRYAEWRAGDKVAEYGLTALVAGGAGAALAKSGLLGKIWKLIVLGAIAALAAIKRVLAAVFGGKRGEESANTAS